MTILKMAEKELIAEGKEYNLLAILDYAVKIRKWIDKHPKTTEIILQGGEFGTRQARYKFNRLYGRI